MKYTVGKLNTTAGIKYILLRDNKPSYSYRSYYKKKSSAQNKANQLNR